MLVNAFTVGYWRFRMDSFTLMGIPLLDFMQIAAGFILTMVVFFSLKKVGWHHWLHYLLLGTFVLQCMIMIVFRPALEVRLFASLMLLTTLIVEVVVGRRRKLTTAKQVPAADDFGT